MDYNVFDKIKREKPQSILLVGKGASGKSYVAQQIAEKFGYTRIDVDNIIREMMIARMVDDKMPYLFKLYHNSRGDDLKEEAKEFLNILRAKMDDPVVLDGMLMPCDIRALGIKMVVIVAPESPTSYARGVKVRFEKDIKEGIASIGSFWSFLDQGAKEDLEGEKYKEVCEEFKRIGWTGRFEEGLRYVMQDLERSVETKKERYAAFNPHVHVNRIA